MRYIISYFVNFYSFCYYMVAVYNNHFHLRELILIVFTSPHSPSPFLSWINLKESEFKVVLSKQKNMNI